MAGKFGNPEVVKEEIDVVLTGGGMGACRAAYEIGPWLKAAKKEGVDLKVTLVDKDAMDRSGAAAQGVSAINTYIGGEQDAADDARMVSNDLMGITCDDLACDLGRHVDDSVHLFEEWGLPIWKQPSDESKSRVDGGKPVRSSKWIVAEAAKKALGVERIQERVFIVKLVNDKNDKNRVAGAVGFSVREDKVFVYKFKACLQVAGGCVNIFRPRAVGEGTGRV
jgi:adenylylsulfate reductase subunit A